jgi:hypothetical protein
MNKENRREKYLTVSQLQVPTYYHKSNEANWEKEIEKKSGVIRDVSHKKNKYPITR